MKPWEQVRLVLEEAKREGRSWDNAWLNAMRSFSPPRTCGSQLRQDLDEERALMHELTPHWQAAYEDRDVTIAEFERASIRTEKRLDSVLCPALAVAA